MGFDIEQLLDCVRRNEWSNEPVTKRDLEDPTAQFVQTVFFNFLTGIGYSKTLLNTNQSEFCILEELGEHAGMYHDVLPVISLQAAMQDLLSKIGGDVNFSIHDLIEPKAKRFKRFLTILVNFYLFSDEQYSKVEDIKNDVDKCVQAKKDFASKNEELRNKISHFKSKKVEEAAEEESLKAEL